MASIVGLRPGPQPLPYSSSKAAIISMTQTMRDKVMFGSDYPSIPYPRLLREWNELGFKDEFLEDFFHGTAERVLGL